MADLQETYRAFTTNLNPVGTAQLTVLDVAPLSRLTNDIALVREDAPSGSLTGLVLDAASGLPIEGDVPVVAHSLNSDLHFGVLALADGSFDIPDLPPGSYRVTASSRNHVSAAEEVTITSTTPLVLNLQLEPDPNGDAGDLQRCGFL